jgi:2-dehydropantoate 2-reductase
MKLCIFGAGAIGGYLGVLLSRTAPGVSLVARGAQLQAIQARGLTLISADGTVTVPVKATADADSLGRQDVVVLTVKAQAVSGVLDQLAPLLGPDTAVVTAQNGVPWWYFHALPGRWGAPRLESVDPGGRIWSAIGPERAIGCVVYPSCELVEPGVVRHLEGTRMMLGEPDGSASARVRALGELFTAAGLKAPVRRRIRDDLWFKLLGNATFNPVSVLTRATLEQMGTDPGTRAVIRAAMTEAVAVGETLGVNFAMDVEKRMDAAVAVGAHRTSMLQDFDAGRPLELDALVAAVVELGALTGVPTATLGRLLALTRLAVAVRDGDSPH